MAVTIRLDEAIDAILDAIKTALSDAMADGELLADVATVVIGERSRPRPELPALWVFGARATNEHNTAALRETWSLPVDLVAVTQGDEPETAHRQAGELAAKARSVAVENRDLGLAYVSDVVSTDFEPSRRYAVDNRTLYSAAATVTVRFQVYE